MAIYKIFPQQSATLYSYYPTQNTGLDEITEISTFLSATSTNEVSRVLIQFPSWQINNVFATLVGTASYDAYLKMYLANATEIPVNYTIESHPVAANWSAGTGRLSDSPVITDGANWSTINGNDAWYTLPTFPAGTTGSYQSGSNIGGGLWYSGSQYTATQSFSSISTGDIELKVTNTVTAWSGSTIPNYGLILKNSASLEFTTASLPFQTQYFSANTHTIYPPCLEIRWNDTIYNTGSLQVMNSDLYVTSLGNNKNKYQQDSVQCFNVKVRAKYPPRTYNTSSFNFNLVNYALPSCSYWSIKDLDTEEIVVDYNTTYTAISCDGTSSYFNVYMNGLEPERYYQLLFKSILPNGETIVFDENYYFKVIR
jgi:hypothetical protein